MCNRYLKGTCAVSSVCVCVCICDAVSCPIQIIVNSLCSSLLKLIYSSKSSWEGNTVTIPVWQKRQLRPSCCLPPVILCIHTQTWQKSVELYTFFCDATGCHCHLFMMIIHWDPTFFFFFNYILPFLLSGFSFQFFFLFLTYTHVFLSFVKREHTVNIVFTLLAFT